MVKVNKNIRDWPKAQSAKPKIGDKGMVVKTSLYRTYNPPEGRVAVRFRESVLGYTKSEDKFIVLYLLIDDLTAL